MQIHVGYISEIVGQFGVIIDSKRKAHGFEIQKSDNFKQHQFVTFKGEDTLVLEVTPLESYPLSKGFCSYKKEAFYIQEGNVWYPCFIVDKQGNRYSLHGGEALVVCRLLDGLPLIPKQAEQWTYEDKDKKIKEILEKVEYVSLHLSEIAESYCVSHEKRHIPKVGGDDRFYVERKTSISYMDVYLSQFFKGDETLFSDSGYTSHFEIPEDVKEEMKYNADDARKAFLQNYDKNAHISTLIFEMEQQEKAKEKREISQLLQFYTAWPIHFENAEYGGYNNLEYRPICKRDGTSKDELIKCIEEYNSNYFSQYMGNVFDDD